METPEQYVKSIQSKQQRHQNEVNNRSDVFIVNFEQILRIVLMFPSASWEYVFNGNVSTYLSNQHSVLWV